MAWSQPNYTCAINLLDTVCRQVSKMDKVSISRDKIGGLEVTSYHNT